MSFTKGIKGRFILDRISECEVLITERGRSLRAEVAARCSALHPQRTIAGRWIQ